MIRRHELTLALITLIAVTAGMPACSDSPSKRIDDGGTEMDVELSDAGRSSGGSGGGVGFGAADAGASPPGEGGMSGGAAGSSATGGGASGGSGGNDDGSSAVGTDASTDAGGTDASDDAGGMDASGGAAGVDGSAAPIASHVHIYISNTCEVSVDPADVTVPQGQTVLFTYHNHSVDYEADVWMSYGGGYLGLVQGDTWSDPIERCSELFSYTAYADVSIHGLGINDPYCPGQRMTIHCE